MTYKYEELGTHKAFISLPLEDFPEFRKSANVVITCDKDDVSVAVRATVYEFSEEGGAIAVTPKQFGDFAIVSKTATVEEMLTELKGVWKTVSEMVESFKGGTIKEQ